VHKTNILFQLILVYLKKNTSNKKTLKKQTKPLTSSTIQIKNHKKSSSKEELFYLNS